jgi:hypothetical protein
MPKKQMIASSDQLFSVVDNEKSTINLSTFMNNEETVNS